MPARWLPYYEGEATAVDVPAIQSETVVHPLTIRSATIELGHIAATTTLHTVSVVASGEHRLTQLPVEVVSQPDNPTARLTQLPVEVVVEPNPPARLTQLPVEVVIEIINPNARLTQLPVEVVVSLSHEWDTILIID